MQPPDRPPEEKLFEQICSGENDAFAQLTEPHRAVLMNFAARTLGHHGDLAEDVVQEAMISAYRAIRAGSQPQNTRAWLFTIVRNCAIDTHRAHRPVLSLEDNEPRSVADVAAVAEQREWMGWLMTAITELPDRQRDVLVGHAIEGHSYSELAQRHQTTVPAVKTLIWRARQRLASAPGLQVISLPVSTLATRLASSISRRAAAVKAILAPVTQTLATSAVASSMLLALPASAPLPQSAAAFSHHQRIAHATAQGATTAVKYYSRYMSPSKSGADLRGGAQRAIHSCLSGNLQPRHYSQAELRYAIRSLPEVDRQYTNCAEELGRAANWQARS